MATISVVHRYQPESFEKTKCVHKYGTQRYTFTGEPFETPYDKFSCQDLCYAKITHQICGCAKLVGWNLTKTDCLHMQEHRNCLMNYANYSADEVFENIDACSLECLPKCNQKFLETQYLKKTHKWTNYISQYNLELVVSKQGAESRKAKELLPILQNSANNSSERARIVESLSQVVIRLKNEQVKIEKIVPLVTLPTFISNLGGILGMCLGLSAISVFELFEKFLHNYLISEKSDDPILLGIPLEKTDEK